MALVTNAGTPGISDPGAFFVSKALAEGIRVTPVPGASAVTAALSVAGTGAERFLFLGFLPTKQGQRRKELGRWREAGVPIVIYEAPHRITETLTDIREILGDPVVILLRELTKVHEEVTRGRTSDILRSLADKEVRGEFVLVLEAQASSEMDLDKELIERISQIAIQDNRSIKDIAKEVSVDTGIPFRKIYKIALEVRRRSGQG